jgi:hypothetical protein
MVMVAIYAALTVRDPMQKRVKALNERREQLKAGIVSERPKKAPRSSAVPTRPMQSARSSTN